MPRHKEHAKKMFDSFNQEFGMMRGYIGEQLAGGGQLPFSLNELISDHPNHPGVKALVKANREAPKIIDGILKDLQSGKTAPLVSYEEPDQSPLTGYDAQIMREKWSCGMDMPGGTARTQGLKHFSKWYLAIFLGNFDEFMNIVDRLSPEELKQQLKKREGVLQLSAIFLPVIGARVLGRKQISYTEMNWLRSEYGSGSDGMHLEILDKLIDLGADVNVHDLAGYTPLHHCLTASCNDMTYEMAEKLLEKGKANPNLVNRFGAPPLSECIMSNNLKHVQLLMEYNADPYIKDNDGCSPSDMGIRSPTVNRLLKTADKRFVKAERDAAKEEHQLKKCGRCSKDASKRCTGCYLVWYCNADCQKSDWDVHKTTCKKIRKEFQEVIMETDNSKFNMNHKKGLNKAATPHFVLKVQVSHNQTDGPMLCYNKERDVEYMMSSTKTDLGRLLKKIIIDKDTRGLYKGYFYSMVKEGKHLINPTMLPPEKW
eukprot:TRINITY_DN1665_c0_g1_i1.p1 TRINITY_DN1665_c0_g1~~TRINITY_DN1665_c0_g1_i1.p1  ORF type:complete len:484 (-),score=131.38 TRINITY_DN1665_c0_g1_i1:879-2330(-)